MGRVLSLYDKSGNWAEPYRERGDLVRCLDLSRGENVILEEYSANSVDVILSAPPCTHLASSGSRWWESKGESALLESLATVDAVFRLVYSLRPSAWAIENPVGRLKRFLGPPRFAFDPCEFAGWADDPESEAYTKRTLLWGDFAIPEKHPVDPVLGSKMHLMPPSEERSDLRSKTPQGFARAFASANPAFQGTGKFVQHG
jgi:hypothetical protein